MILLTISTLLYFKDSYKDSDIKVQALKEDEKK